MKIGATFSEIEPCAATIGFFDGVHCGHRFLINHLRQAASARGLASAVVTFPTHPCKVVRPDSCPALLTTCAEKVELLASTGLDYCIMLDFTSGLASLTARRFMELLHTRYRVEVLLVGYDHHFGHPCGDTFADYERYGRELGMEVLPAPGYGCMDGRRFSSSLIRSLLEKGRVEEAASCLGYEYFLRGTVTDGHHVGRRLGYPTANLRVNDSGKLVPADGVYAVLAEVDGQAHGGMLCIGRRPTIGNGPERSIETHIFDFDADIYHHDLCIRFVRYVRPAMKFGSVDGLVERLHADEAEIRAILAGFLNQSTSLSV